MSSAYASATLVNSFIMPITLRLAVGPTRCFRIRATWLSTTAAGAPCTSSTSATCPPIRDSRVDAGAKDINRQQRALVGQQRHLWSPELRDKRSYVAGSGWSVVADWQPRVFSSREFSALARST